MELSALVSAVSKISLCLSKGSLAILKASKLESPVGMFTLDSPLRMHTRYLYSIFPKYIDRTI